MILKSGFVKVLRASRRSEIRFQRAGGKKGKIFGAIINQPRSCATGGIGARPSIISQNGPLRATSLAPTPR